MTNKYNNQKNNSELEKVASQWKIVSAILFLILLTFVINTYFFSKKADDKIIESSNKYPLIDISRHLISQDHFLSTLQPLRERLYKLVDQEKNFDISIYIEYLNTGSNININQDHRFWMASLAKLTIAIVSMKMVEEGLWSLNQRLTLENGDRIKESSTLYEYPEGSEFTVQKLLEELLIRSDNTAYRIFLRNIPVSQLKSFNEAIGLEELFDDEGRITAKEYSRILRTLYVASYLNRENSEFILELLNKSEFKDFLNRDIPTETPFPHKYGAYPEENIYNDAGIVYIPNRPYMIVVTMKGKSNLSQSMNDAENIMHAISNMTYEYIFNAKNK